MGDKYARISNYIKKGDFKFKEESIKDTLMDMDPIYWVHHIACIIIAALTYVGLPPCMFTFASCFAEMGGGFINLWKVGIAPRWLTMIVMTASNFTVAYLLYPMWQIMGKNMSDPLTPYIFETLCVTTFMTAGLMLERERQTILVLYYGHESDTRKPKVL